MSGGMKTITAVVRPLIAFCRAKLTSSFNCRTAAFMALPSPRPRRRGRLMAAMIAMMTMTTNISASVKAWADRRLPCPSP